MSNNYQSTILSLPMIKNKLRTIAAAMMILTAPLIADDAVDFELNDIDGNVHRLSDFRGEWVVVNFWATWCGPCVREIPILNEVDSMSDPVDAVVIGIDFEEIDRKFLREAMEKLNIGYLVLRIGSAPLIPFEPLKGLPSTFIVSPQGDIVYRHAGEIDKETLIEMLRKVST